MARVGLLGGAFDPPHLGHLKLAELAWAHLGLEELRFLPAAQSPDKAKSQGSPDQRRALLEAALSGTPWRLEAFELERPGPSFTVDTLEALRQREPDQAWILILGSDRLDGLGQWKTPDRLLALTALAVAPRPGFPIRIPEGLGLREVPVWSGAPGEFVRLPGTDLDLASSSIRSALRHGGGIEGISSQVKAAIERENLYRG